MTMAAPMVISSFPFRTSPVKRGAWLFETIFNRPPTEPKVAFVIEKDTKHAAEETSTRLPLSTSGWKLRLEVRHDSKLVFQQAGDAEMFPDTWLHAPTGSAVITGSDPPDINAATVRL